MPITISLNKAVDAEMLIMGALFIEIVGKAPNGKLYESKQMCYIARGLETFYLSQEACKDLGVLAKDFPKL